MACTVHFGELASNVEDKLFTTSTSDHKTSIQQRFARTKDKKVGTLI